MRRGSGAARCEAWSDDRVESAREEDEGRPERRHWRTGGITEARRRRRERFARWRHKFFSTQAGASSGLIRPRRWPSDPAASLLDIFSMTALETLYSFIRVSVREANVALSHVPICQKV